MKSDLLMNINVKKRSGNSEPLILDKINKSAERGCEGLKDVSASEIVLDASIQLYSGVSTIEIDKALIMSARSKIEKEPNYSYVAARLLLNNLYKEVFGTGVEHELFEEQYKAAFTDNLEHMVDIGRINPELLEKFDIAFLADHIKPNRDLLFKYLGIQTLYDRYFINEDGRKLETPQAFFMRIAMGLCLNESEPEIKAIEIYNEISQFHFMPSSPTLFNSGTCHSQLSSCYLSTMEDSEDGIMGTIHDQARLSKYASGVAVDWGHIRAEGSHIKKTNGKSSGPVPFMKIFNDTLVAFDQGGKRKGSGVAYIPCWHLNIEDFCELKKNTGDERRRCHDMNTALWCSDLFFKKAFSKTDEDWYLFSPSDVPNLHKTYGEEFEKLYESYVKMAEKGKIKNFKKVKAKHILKKIISAAFETGHPWVCFKDAANICYSNKNEGTIFSSNLCTEICRHTHATIYHEGQKRKLGETAVCNLASVNLMKHILKGKINKETLKKSIQVAVRALDNVIDINYYPIREAQISNNKHRPIGLGIMGFSDLLHAMELPYESKEAALLAEELQEFISYWSIDTSIELAKERGRFSTFVGSEWEKGNLPHDMANKLAEFRETKYKINHSISKKDYEVLKEKLAINGIRNSSIMAIAPTATISSIVGCGQSIEPDYGVLYVYSTLSGEFTVVNEWFVQKMKKLGLWCDELVTAIKQVDGDVLKLKIPDDVKKEFKGAFDIDYHYLVDAAAARQRFIDMGQSFNLYCDKPSMKYLSNIYEYCFDKGLKTTYYVRNKAVSKVEKSSVETCSVEAMRRGEVCESCQ